MIWEWAILDGDVTRQRSKSHDSCPPCDCVPRLTLAVSQPVACCMLASTLSYDSAFLLPQCHCCSLAGIQDSQSVTRPALGM